MSSSSKSRRAGSLDPEIAAALDRFPLEPWLARNGFDPQGRRKQEWIQDCPWCGAEEKLSVNPRARWWRCFVCERQFTLLDLIAHFEGGYANAMQLVAITSGGRSLAIIPEDFSGPMATEERSPLWEPRALDPPQHFVPLTAPHPYAARRGLSWENMQRLGVGVCTWGRYQDRLVFPVRRWWDGAWIYYQARATWEKEQQAPSKDGKVRYRKNLNPDLDPEVFDPAHYAQAADVLMGLEHLDGAQRVALVEGPTDLVQTMPAAVALLGKVLSPRKLMLLIQAGVKEIDLCLDPDAWAPPMIKTMDGRMVPTGRPPPAQKVAQLLEPHFVVRVVRYPVGFDPGDYSPADNALWRASARRWGDGDRLARIP